jgi:hypothetical protein
MPSTFLTTALMKNLKNKFAELHVRLVTGHCYGVVSYKASHATAIIFWSIVLPIWVLIFPYSSTNVLCCRPLPPRLMHAYPFTFKIIAWGPYCNAAVEEEKVSASSVQESVWCVWKWFWACLDCRMMEWWLVWIHKYHMTSLVCIEKLNKILELLVRHGDVLAYSIWGDVKRFLREMKGSFISWSEVEGMLPVRYCVIIMS